MDYEKEIKDMLKEIKREKGLEAIYIITKKMFSKELNIKKELNK